MFGFSFFVGAFFFFVGAFLFFDARPPSLFVSAFLLDDLFGAIFLICIKEKLGQCRRGEERE